MKNAKSYLIGALIGMIGEYLYRVNFNWPAAITLCVLVLYVMLDLTIFNFIRRGL